MNPVMSEEVDDLGVFLDRAIHDLRAPLRKVRVAAELLKTTASASENPKSQAYVEQVLSGVDGMDKILSSLVQYSLSQQHSAYTFTRVSTETALLSALASLQEDIHRKGAQVTHESLPHTEGDPDRLADLFRHLLDNALTYARSESPRIFVRALRQPDHWVLSVEDNGIGIEPRYRTRVFAPFYRLHGAEIPGVGLGLTICNKVVKGHRGRIWIDSGSENGAKFLFTLPAIDDVGLPGSPPLRQNTSG